jgi:hypothetical protein
MRQRWRGLVRTEKCASQARREMRLWLTSSVSKSSKYSSFSNDVSLVGVVLLMCYNLAQALQKREGRRMHLLWETSSTSTLLPKQSVSCASGSVAESDSHTLRETTSKGHHSLSRSALSLTTPTRASLTPPHQIRHRPYQRATGAEEPAFDVAPNEGFHTTLHSAPVPIPAG